MQKRDIERALLQYTNGAILINLSGIAKALRKRKSWAAEITAGLDCLEDGRQRQYLVNDVAGVLAEKMRH